MNVLSGWKWQGSVVAASLLLMSPTSDAQRSERLKRLGAKVLAGQVVENLTTKAMGGNPDAASDYTKDHWNNATFNPPLLEGYHHFRLGNSDQGQYGSGAGGRYTCDPSYFLSAITKIPMTSKGIATCSAQEQFLQERALEYDGRLRADWPQPGQMIKKRLEQFSHLPLKLYFRFNMPGLVHPEETPKGLVFLIGDVLGTQGLLGIGSPGSPEVDITLKGPDVKYEFDTYLTKNLEPGRITSSSGELRILTKFSDAQIDSIMSRPSFGPTARNKSWDTIFFTIHSIRPIPKRLSSYKPNYEIEITLDKMEFGVDPGHRPPINKLTVK